MINEDLPEPEILRSLLNDFSQLMFCHFPVRFVIDSLDLAPILRAANDPKKINRRADGRLDFNRRRLKRRFGY